MERPKYGSLEVIFGPMFSGKTSELMRRIRKFEMCGYKCTMIRYSKDNRYSSNEAASHDGSFFSAVSALLLFDVQNTVINSDVIGIDEGQFFQDIVEFCKLYLKLGKIVIVAGLDGTFQKTGFGDFLDIVPLATKVDKLSAVCMSCGAKAAFTRRLGDETEVEVIGGADKYMAVCRACYKLDYIETYTPFCT